MNEKAEQRKNAKVILAAQSNSDFDKWNSSISKNLSKFLSDTNSENKIVGGFAPILHEPAWLNDQGLNVQLAFPAFDKVMVFKVSNITELETRLDFGVQILGPKENAKEVLPEILLVPGLSFTLDGKRLGRGKGYYDRYLENFKGIKIGICYECQLLNEITTEAHDQKMNFIITEKNIYRI